MVKAVLFDMDGVLIDSHDAWFYIFNKAYNKFEDKTMSVEDFDKYLWAKAFDEIAEEYFTVPVEEIREYYVEIYEDYRKRLKVMDGTKEALRLLKKKGLKLAVVSNTQGQVVKKILKDVKLDSFFSLCLGGDDVPNGKPAPDILIKALELLSLNKEDVLFVGDTKWDRMAASNADVKFVGFRIKGDIKVNMLKEVASYVS